MKRLLLTLKSPSLFRQQMQADTRLTRSISKTFAKFLWALLVLFFLSSITGYAKIDTALQMQLGNPSGATADTNNHDHYLIQRTVEALDYNDNRGLPNWASWDLTAADIGTNSRSSFSTDTNLPANFNWITSGDYTHSGYTRGHLCPSKDRTESATNNDLVFFMSNVIPQNSINNSGVWLQFENYCRSLVQSSNNYELLIICGPSGFRGVRINTNGPVLIPDYVWKIVVIVPPGSGVATNRIAATNRVIAIKIPNNDTATNTWPTYLTSANQIQVDTGLTFFTSLSPESAAALRGKVDGQTNPPPAIGSFSPAIGSSGTTITIIGTNFTGVTAVAFNGVTATFNLESDSQITAMVPTNAGSGFVSITTSSGTAISSNTFTVVNNGGPVYSGILAGWDVSALPGGSNNYGPSPYAPATNAQNLSVMGLTRSAGVKTSGTAAARAWGGTSFTNINASAAIASNQFLTFSITASNGYAVSFSSISRFDYYRSSTGPTNGILQFQLGSGAFTDITNLYYPNVSSGASIGPIDLSGFAALQKIGAQTNISFRIVNFGGTSSTGTWYIYDTLATSAPDLVLQGTVTQIVTTNAPSAPTVSQISFANNQISLTVNGIVGANYVVEATTNLAPSDWVPLQTNIAPFSFIESNAALFNLRFYRAVVAP